MQGENVNFYETIRLGWPQTRYIGNYIASRRWRLRSCETAKRKFASEWKMNEMVFGVHRQTFVPKIE